MEPLSALHSSLVKRRSAAKTSADVGRPSYILGASRMRRGACVVRDGKATTGAATEPCAAAADSEEKPSMFAKKLVMCACLPLLEMGNESARRRARDRSAWS